MINKHEFFFMLMMFILQAIENNEEMRNRSRRESSAELPAPVVDKVSDLTATM